MPDLVLKHLPWLTWLSLDAPLVTVSWQALLSQSIGHRLVPSELLIVFLAVWLGYAADRLFDNRRHQAPSSAQHRFYRKRKAVILGIWPIVLALALWLSFTQLDAEQLKSGFSLMGASLAYSLYAQKARATSGYAVVKPLCTALLITAAASLFLWNELLTGAKLPLLLIPWLLFSVNCLLIRGWSKENDKSPLTLAAPFAALCFLGSLALSGRDDKAVAYAALISLSALAVLHFNRINLPCEVRRVLADIALLSPLLFLALS